MGKRPTRGRTIRAYSIGEVVPGDVLNIGNPNCRVKVNKPIGQFFEEWCQHAPPHHIALGIGDFGQAIDAFGEAMGFKVVRI